ncbi:MAG: pyruvate kinase, partial [Lysobacterales bacterium]
MNKVQQQSSTPSSMNEVVKQVESLRRSIEEHAELHLDTLRDLPPERIASAQNLLHYLALRQEDIRPLQDKLTQLGLSSLGRVEPHVLATIDAVLRNLYLLNEQAVDTLDLKERSIDFTKGGFCLKENTARLFGEQPGNRRDHIMVTMPIEAADDYLMVHQLLISGMNCMRINCAHDYPEIWSRMIETLRNAEQSTGLSCRILMDLGGPKLRLGPMETKPAVIKIRP